MRILILTAAFGMGHRSAAEALAEQYGRLHPTAEVSVVDLLTATLPQRAPLLYKAFALLVTRGSGVFNAHYRATEGQTVGGHSLLVSAMEAGLLALLEEKKPDLIVSTHPLCSQAVAHCKEQGRVDVPLTTVITDLTAHGEWIYPHTDRYLVGATAVKEGLVAKGVPSSNIHVTGIPVARPYHTAWQTANGREDGKRHLLIMGGGLGLLPQGCDFYQRLNDLPQVQVTLITGHNQEAYAALRGRYENIEVLGFCDTVWEEMAKADLILTKPGGITTFEAIHSRLPILAWEPFLAQEENNARWLQRNGMGAVAPKAPEACLEAIKRLLYDRPTLNKMSLAMDGFVRHLMPDYLALLPNQGWIEGVQAS